MRTSDNVAGALVMAASASCFAGMNACANQLAALGMPLSAIVCARCTIALVMMTLSMPWTTGHRQLKTQRPGWHLLRSLASSIAVTTCFVALAEMALADATTLISCYPLLLAMLSGPLLGESLKPGQWLAVLLGLVGVVVIVEPSADIISDWPALLAIVAALVIAVECLVLRHMASTESPFSVTYYFLIFSSVASSIWVGLEGQSFATDESWPYLVLIGLFGGSAQWLLAAAFSRGEASVVAPVQYLSVVVAALIGYLGFGEALGLRVIIGALLIVSAGVYTVHARPAG